MGQLYESNLVFYILGDSLHKTRRMYAVTLWPPDVLRARARTRVPCQAAAAGSLDRVAWVGWGPQFD